MTKKDPKQVEQKDLDRLRSLKAKSRGDIDKAIQYAIAMAKAITDGYKAWRRYLAAVEIYRFDSLVTIPFLDRAVQSGVPEAVEEKKKLDIYRAEKSGISALVALGFDYNLDKTYEENVRVFLKQDASIWDKVYIPEGVEKAKENKVHRMLSGLGVWQ